MFGELGIQVDGALGQRETVTGEERVWVATSAFADDLGGDAVGVASHHCAGHEVREGGHVDQIQHSKAAQKKTQVT